MVIAQIGTFPQNIKKIRGGIEASVSGLSFALSKENSIFVFDTPRNDLENDFVEINEDVTIYRYRGKGNNFNSLKRVKKIIEDIKSINPDICHIHGSGYLQNKLYKLLSAENYKVIVTIHGLQHIEKKNELSKKKNIRSLIKYYLLSKSEFDIIENSKTLIVDTIYVEDQIIDYRKRRKIKKIPQITVIPQGIDSHYFSVKRNPKGVVLLCIGGICRRKGQIKLLECFHEVFKQSKDVQLIIAGFISEREYYDELILNIRERDLENSVKVLTQNNQEDIFNLYTQASLFVLYSAEESQGIVLAEAMATGLPVVATEVGGIPYVVKNNINGLLSDYNNQKEFTDNIKTVLSDRKLYNSMSAINKESAKLYDWDAISDQILKLYNSITV